MIVALALLLGIQPTTGPVLPLKMCDKMERVQASAGGMWTSGTLQAFFAYTSAEPIAKLAEQLRKERPDAPPYTNKNGAYSYYRKVGAVTQQVSIWLAGRWSDAAYDKRHGTKHIRLTTMDIQEYIDPLAPAPTSWFGPAIAPNPPAPLIEAPFLPGRKAQSVMLESFDGLMSSKGIMYKGDDARIYMVYDASSGVAMEKRAEKWALANGYSKTQYGHYFRAGNGIFEFSVGGYLATGSVITMWWSQRTATHPIVMEKF